MITSVQEDKAGERPKGAPGGQARCFIIIRLECTAGIDIDPNPRGLLLPGIVCGIGTHRLFSKRTLGKSGAQDKWDTASVHLSKGHSG